MKKYFIVFTVLIASALVIFSCKRDKGVPDLSLNDEKLFVIVKDTAGAGYYKDNSGTSIFTSDPAHGARPYKLRINSKGFAALTASGKLPTNGVFPDSSLIVKELHTGTISDPIADYSVFFKLNGGWNYAQYKNDGTFSQGTTIWSVQNDPANCKTCHNSVPTDNVLTFLVHP